MNKEDERDRLARIERQLQQAASVFLGAEPINITGSDLRWLVRMLRVFMGPPDRKSIYQPEMFEQQKSRKEHQGQGQIIEDLKADQGYFRETVRD